MIAKEFVDFSEDGVISAETKYRLHIWLDFTDLLQLNWLKQTKWINKIKNVSNQMTGLVLKVWKDISFYLLKKIRNSIALIYISSIFYSFVTMMRHRQLLLQF